MHVRTNLMLPEELVVAIDALAGPRGRSRYVADALTRQVQRDRQQAAFESTFGTLSSEDYPAWSSSGKVVDWVRERRLDVTDPGLEDDRVPGPGLDVRHRPPEGRS